MDRDEELLNKMPTLRAYIRRIGAEPRNFRTYVVRDKGDGGYWRDRVIVRIKGGTISVRGADEDAKPTETELKLIESEIAEANLPKPIAAGLHARPLAEDGWSEDADDLVFAFRSLDGNQLLFLEQRKVRADGGKDVLPWSFWSDGTWRNLEPDWLPLYGLDRLKNAAKVFLHEGAKAADAMQQMADAEMPQERERLAEHPWGPDLSYAVHLGWPGGVNRAHGVDWGPIRGLPASVRVILVCDNDQGGKEAARTISRALKGRSLEVVMFDDRFPDGFDLADRFPECLFKNMAGRRTYRGPLLVDCLRTATWATRVIATGDRGRPAHEILPAFLGDWAFSVEPLVFVPRNNPRTVFAEQGFNAAVRPFSDVDGTAALLRKHPSAQVAGVCYEPDHPPGIIASENGRKMNLWTPTDIRPAKGDVQPYLDFMERLIPLEADRHAVLRWCATLIARPGVRIRYGVLMTSRTQGVGKSTLMERVLAPLVGWHNVSIPSETQIVDSAFNSWLGRRRLVLVHEIYAGGSKRAYNKLKSVMTDDTLTVNEKYKPEYELRNWVHIAAASNSKAPLKMAMQDRRWLVPGVTESKQEPGSWKRLNEWLAGPGLGAIHQWALDYLTEHGAVGSADEAPTTLAKSELIVDTMSEGQRLLYDLGLWMMELGDWEYASSRLPLGDHVGCTRMGGKAGDKIKLVTTDRDVRRWLAKTLGRDLNDSKLESLMTVREVLQDAGVRIVCMRKVKGERQAVLANFDVDVELAELEPDKRKEWPALEGFYRNADRFGLDYIAGWLPL